MTKFKRSALLVCTFLATTGSLATVAHAQSTSSETTLQEIIVTAQKREENLQNVPISVTAVTAKNLEANHITNVSQLGAVAPNVSVRMVAGGDNIPSFSIRGNVSLGVVAGSDKSVSLYVDGVYIGSANGEAFELPDLERIEVLKGPQGTLFGRNATAGAVNIVTRDPPGKFGVRQDFTYGNYNQFKTRTRIDFPAWHDISTSVSFIHDERQGDIRNLGAGTTWDFSGSPAAHEGVLTSPKYLGDKNANIASGALRWKPTDNFTLTNKFDWSENHYTPAGVGSLGINSDPVSLGPTFKGILLAVGNSPSLFNVYPTRPKALNNSFSTPSYETNYGDSLTLQYRVNDNLTLKNIAAFRYTYLFANDELDGIGGLHLAGLPFLFISAANQYVGKQWSDEAQANYQSKYLTMTVGALYFYLNSRQGGPLGLPGAAALSCAPGGNFGALLGRFCTTPPAGPPGPDQDVSGLNTSKSYAAYVQLEGHITDQLDIVGGYRITKDDKSGSYNNGGLPAPIFFAPLTFTYSKTKPTYLIGLNYKPMDNLLLYVKYATGFVSGGSTAGLAYQAETAHSYEGGIKATLLDRRLRANLAVWDVTYDHLQNDAIGLSVASLNPIYATVPAVVLDQGSAHARGFEGEVSALPMRGLNLSAMFGYTDFKYTQINPFGNLFGNLSDDVPTYRPKWTADFSGTYETEPLFNDVRGLARIDASFRSSERFGAYPSINPYWGSLNSAPDQWLLNARIGLEHLNLGPTKADISFWVENLTDDKSPIYGLFVPLNPPLPGQPSAPNQGLTNTFGQATYQPARTFGVDISFTY